VLLAVMLLYVGAVLVVNGIWLIGQARAADAGRQPTEAAGGRQAAPPAVAVEAHPTFMQGREVAVMNLFTGFFGAAVAVTLLVQADSKADLASARGAVYILLFAFTYLWVAYSQYLKAGSHAFGWYCLFVGIAAVPAGVFTFANAKRRRLDLPWGFTGSGPACLDRRAQATDAQLSHPSRARRGGDGSRMTPALRATPSAPPMHRGRVPASSCPHACMDGSERLSGRTAYPCGITPSTIMSPTRNHSRPWTNMTLRARTPESDRPARRRSSASLLAHRAALRVTSAAAGHSSGNHVAGDENVPGHAPQPGSRV
jgi:hypothetical protein